jgi:hypothetical protein
MAETHCGAVLKVDGRDPLVCNLDPDHALPHGVREAPAFPPFLRWPVAYVLDVTRDSWRKPHVRRSYVAPSQWVAPR